MQLLQCTHSPKYVRLTIDIGMNEISHLELCKSCHEEQKLKFVISEDVLD